jgi:hypothetical protein
LEFSGQHPGLNTVEISKAPETITLFIAGDSTVTEQAAEPWAGWGQMLPRFFNPGVAIANHAESGLTLYSFKGQRRLDKTVSAMNPGDYFFIQFGHNDQKDKTPGSGPFTSCKENLKFLLAKFETALGIEESKKGVRVLSGQHFWFDLWLLESSPLSLPFCVPCFLEPCASDLKPAPSDGEQQEPLAISVPTPVLTPELLHARCIGPCQRCYDIYPTPGGSLRVYNGMQVPYPNN